jgi:hypothetical protein
MASAADFAAGTVPGLATDSASARCCEAIDNAKTAAAATPRRRSSPHRKVLSLISDPP